MRICLNFPTKLPKFLDCSDTPKFPRNCRAICVRPYARAPFEGVTTFDSYGAWPNMRVASEIQSWGEGPTSGESSQRRSDTLDFLVKFDLLMEFFEPLPFFFIPPSTENELQASYSL